MARLTENQLRELYTNQGYGMPTIASMAGYASAKSVLILLNRYGIPIRPKREAAILREARKRKAGG